MPRRAFRAEKRRTETRLNYSNGLIRVIGMLLPCAGLIEKALLALLVFFDPPGSGCRHVIFCDRIHTGSALQFESAAAKSTFLQMYL